MISDALPRWLLLTFVEDASVNSRSSGCAQQLTVTIPKQDDRWYLMRNLGNAIA